MMKVNPVNHVAQPQKVVRRLQQPYEDKAHIGTGEVPRDADYAQAIWKYENKSKQLKDLIVSGVFIGLVLLGFYLLGTWVAGVSK